MTFKLLAALRTDGAVGTVDDWEWTGPPRTSPPGASDSAGRGWPRLADDVLALAATHER